MKALEDAEKRLDRERDAFLLKQIIEYREQVKDRNRHIRDYVEELGLARPANYG